jgi:hypothetical protein
MNRPRKSSKPTEPRRTAAISTGQFVSGSLFRLVREIRGSAYSVGDQFMLLDEADCHDPNILKLGGVGEAFFTDPRGLPLKIEAGDKQIDSIFEYVETPFEMVLEEAEETAPPEESVLQKQVERLNEQVQALPSPVVKGERGERGERGTRGFQGVQGDRGPKGDAGPMGATGPAGAIGATGPQGERGSTGEKGDKGDRGEIGPRGERGERGEKGQKGDRGEKGERGERGQRGEKGDKGDKGQNGVAGAVGPAGPIGPVGPRGERGERGSDGKPGAAGKRGPKGSKGERGDRGDTGESGVISAEFPLVYDKDEKSIKIDEQRLEKILKRIIGGKSVSAADMGWLASTGGGGKVAVYVNGTKVTPDVRVLDFTGTGVTVTHTKVGGKVTVNINGAASGGISGDYVKTFNGSTGDVTGVSQLIAGSNITISGSTGAVTISSTATADGGTNFFYQTTPPVAGVTVGSRWMDSENGQEYIYIDDGNSQQWVQPSVPSIISPTINTVVGYTGETYSATQLDYYIGISYNGPTTVVMPSEPETGREIIVKDEAGHSGNWNKRITIVGADGELIDNKSSAVININSAALHFIYRNGWRIV